MKVLALLLAAFVGSAHAVDVLPVAKLGVEWGGSTIVVAEFDNGDTDALRANEGFYLGGGVVMRAPRTPLEFELSLAFKYATIEARNGDIEWTRWPLEALVFYRLPRWRAGGGLAYHLAPTLDGDGAASELKVRFKNTLGAVLQADWRITEELSLGARYVYLRYEAKEPGEEGARADGWGIAFSYTF